MPTKSLTRKINVSCNKIFTPSKTKVKLENEDNEIKQATPDEAKALLENIIKEVNNGKISKR